MTYPENFEDDLSSQIQDLVRRGLVEQYIDENGDFIFELTEIGKRVANDIRKSGEEN